MSLKALGGGPLFGKKLVRLVYVDEAGIGGRAQEPFVVVAGIVADADRTLRPLEAALDEIINRHVPAEFRAGFILHAKEIFHGNSKPDSFLYRKHPEFKTTRRDMRWAICADLAELPARLELSICIGIVRVDDIAAEWLIEPRSRVTSAHIAAFGSFAIALELWMRAYAADEFCMLIVEDNEAARSGTRSILRSFQSKAFAEEMLTQAERAALPAPFRMIREDPLYQAKRPGSALQLADFAAYILKRVLMGDTECNRYYEPMQARLIAYRWTNPPEAAVEAESAGR